MGLFDLNFNIHSSVDFALFNFASISGIYVSLSYIIDLVPNTIG